MRCSSYSETLYKTLATKTEISGEDWLPVRATKHLAHLSNRVLCVFLSFVEIAIVAAPRVAIAPCAKLFSKRDFFVINVQVLSAKEAFSQSLHGTKPKEESTKAQKADVWDEPLQVLEKKFLQFAETHQRELATVAVICLVAYVYFRNTGADIPPAPEFQATMETVSLQTSSSIPDANPFDEICSIDEHSCGLFGLSSQEVKVDPNDLAHSTALVVRMPPFNFHVGSDTPVPSPTLPTEPTVEPAPHAPPISDAKVDTSPPPSPIATQSAPLEKEETPPPPFDATTPLEPLPYHNYFAFFVGGAGIASLIGVAFCRRGNVQIHNHNTIHVAGDFLWRAVDYLTPTKFRKRDNGLTQLDASRVQRVLFPPLGTSASTAHSSDDDFLPLSDDASKTLSRSPSPPHQYPEEAVEVLDGLNHYRKLSPPLPGELPPQPSPYDGPSVVLPSPSRLPPPPLRPRGGGGGSSAAGPPPDAPPAPDVKDIKDPPQADRKRTELLAAIKGTRTLKSIDNSGSGAVAGRMGGIFDLIRSGVDLRDTTSVRGGKMTPQKNDTRDPLMASLEDVLSSRRGATKDDNDDSNSGSGSDWDE